MTSVAPNHVLEIVATVCFVAAVLHTFATQRFAAVANRFPKGSVGDNFFHYLAEVEIVFGLWAFVFLACMAGLTSTDDAVKYLEGVHFAEPAFVFVVMAVASTKPIMDLASLAMTLLARVSPRRIRPLVWFGVCMTVGPLLGSFITEPAAMTVVALLLRDVIFKPDSSSRLRYSTLAVLLVNISIGGTLTHFAAPPVVMVAEKWNWGMAFMFEQFGWKAAVAVLVNAAIVISLNYRELSALPTLAKSQQRSPIWLTVTHIFFLALVVRYHHSMAFFIPLFLLFLGWHQVTGQFQEPLKLRESLLVGFFLGGLVTLGQMQSWWISPVISSLSEGQLYLSAAALTAITDNAAITYLASLVPGLSPVSQYAVVAGAVVGGGLTVIANAPNPIAVGLLGDGFEERAVSPLMLFAFALPPTMVAGACLWFF